MHQKARLLVKVEESDVIIVVIPLVVVAGRAFRRHFDVKAWAGSMLKRKLMLAADVVSDIENRNPNRTLTLMELSTLLFKKERVFG